MAFNSGASLYGDRLLVYGAKTAILDVRTGETVWSFEMQKLRSFPIDLDEKQIPWANSSAAGISATDMDVTMSVLRKMIQNFDG